jgi:hypothetical protein
VGILRHGPILSARFLTCNHRKSKASNLMAIYPEEKKGGGWGREIEIELTTLSN